MEKILVSACLLGTNCRYDGKSKPNEAIMKLQRDYDLVPFCPEVEGGLSTPRPRSEIQPSGRVKNELGEDVTKHYELGAQKALNICRFLGISIAILKDASPACGPRKIHDGQFKGNKIDGQGITARLLIQNGIKVYAETDALDFLLRKPSKKKEDRKTRAGSYKKTYSKKKHPNSGNRTGFRQKRGYFLKANGKSKPYSKASEPTKGE